MHGATVKKKTVKLRNRNISHHSF